jgi:hypothetical protein
MDNEVFLRRHQVHAFDSNELREVKHLFEWAQSYESQGLSIAAEALRDQAKKAFLQFMSAAPKAV